MMRKWLFATAMLLPGAALALGLGKLDLNSALNEPFDARIRLLSASVEELDSLKAGLASPEAFERAGLEYGFGLSKLKFEVRETEQGPDYIRVYSSEPIREPFLNFLLEINWSQGRLYREYTVLLDPPTYDPSRKMAAAMAPAPVAETYAPAQTIEDNQVTYDLEYAASAAPAYTPSISYSGGDYGPTGAGDTLWSIASAMRPDSSVSVQQMMIALLRANPEAFIDNNINGLKRGHILSMPSEADINSVGKSEALELAKSQNNLWNDIRTGMAETVTERPESAGVSGTEAEAAPVMEEVEGEAELRLVAPDTSGEGIDEAMTEPGEDTETQQLLALANETISALELENTELKDKLVESESIIDDLKRLIQLKEDELAVLQDQIAAAAAMEEEEMPAEEETMEAEAAIEEEAPVEEPAMEEEMAEEEMAAEAEEEMAEPAPMGMVDQYLGPIIEIVKSNLIVIGGAVGGVIVLLLGFAMYKKRQSGQAESVEIPEAEFPDFEEVTEAGTDVSGAESMMDIGESEGVTEMPEAEEQEDKTPTPEIPEQEGAEEATEFVSPPAEEVAPEPEEEEDPLAEVNVFLAYEHFDQAEEFVKNAIESEPDNLEFHSKLLEVYYAASNKKSYEEHARVLHDKVKGQGPHWDMAVAMWSELSPNRALFEQGAEEEEEAPAAAGGGVMDLTAGEEETAEEAEAGGLDFDIGGDEDEDVLDVTVGADMEEAEAKPAASDEDEILDVTAAIDSDTSDEELLDVTAAIGLDEAMEEPEATAETDEELLDITGGASDDEVLDITSGAEQPAAEEDVLDISTGADLSTDAEEEDNLDISQQGGEGLLDVTASANLTPDSDEDLLDVTSASTAGADSDSLLDVGTGDEETAEKVEGDVGLDFDVEGLDLDVSDESSTEEKESESMIEQAMEGEGDNIIEFESAKTDGDEEDIEGTVEVDAAMLGIESPTDEEVETPDVDLDLTMDVESPEESATDEILDLTAGAESVEEAESGADDLSLDIEIPDSGETEEDEISLDLSDTGEEDVSLDMEAEEAPELSLDISEESSAETPADDLSLDLDIMDESEEEPAPAETTGDEVPEIDMDGTVELPKEKMDFQMEDDDEEKTVFVPKSSATTEQSQEDEVSTKLDLAKAYVELGDGESAKAILEEIMNEGTEEQQQQAQDLLNQV